MNLKYPWGLFSGAKSGKFFEETIWLKLQKLPFPQHTLETAIRGSLRGRSNRESTFSKTNQFLEKSESFCFSHPSNSIISLQLVKLMKCKLNFSKTFFINDVFSSTLQIALFLQEKGYSWVWQTTLSLLYNIHNNDNFDNIFCFLWTETWTTEIRQKIPSVLHFWPHRPSWQASNKCFGPKGFVFVMK